MSYKNAASPEEVFSHSCVTQFMGRDIPHWGAPKSPDDLLSAFFVWEWIVSLGGPWKMVATSRILLVRFCYMSTLKKIIKFQYLKHSSLCSVHRNYNQSTKFCFVTAAQIQMSSFIYFLSSDSTSVLMHFRTGFGSNACCQQWSSYACNNQKGFFC